MDIATQIDWDFEIIKPTLIYQFKNEHDLLLACEDIHRCFIERSEMISEYFQHAKYVAAYAALYFPTNAPKLNFLFSQLPTEYLDFLKGQNCLDFGCGPGTFSFLLASFGLKVKAFDHSSLMIEQAQRLKPLFKHLKLEDHLQFQNTQPKKEKGVLFLGHILNELNLNQMIELVSTYEGSEIILIEPGTKQSFEQVMVLREWLLNHGYKILYPCPLPSDCPVQKRGDWCHQLVHAAHNPAIERWLQILKLNRRQMPMVAQVYSREFTKTPAYPYNLRLLRETKHSFELELCENILQELKIQRIEISKKTLSKETKQMMKSFDWGQRIDYELEKEFKDFKRVKLKQIL
jgi:ribosomal protein RSM22 (predicted rRNA methylase)